MAHQYKQEHMTTTKHIPVSEQTRDSLRELKKPGQTYDGLLADLVEHEKERRFLMEMTAIKAEGDFVEFAL